MRDATIHRVHPDPRSDLLTDADLLSLYSIRQRSKRHVRANFISSIDGSSSASGLSGPLGSPADKRVFDVLRQLSDVVLVGAGTARDEGYGALRLGDEAARWRVDHGLAPQPTFAIVTAALQLDPSSRMFTDAPVRPLIFTIDSANAERRTMLDAVADVASCRGTSVDVAWLIRELEDRGLCQVHCEGGPSLLGALIEADELDELCLTLSPVLEGGTGARVSTSISPTALRRMQLEHVLLSGSMMFTRYLRVA